MAELVGCSDLGLIDLIVLQPTTFCDLDCRYCYLLSRNDRRRMARETLGAIGRNLLSSPLVPEGISIVWHGGEPTLLPPDWYDDAFRLLAEAAPSRSVRHAFQTNGLHIDGRWIDLWRRWGVSVGISLDGPAAIHDRNRRTRRGTGSFTKTIRGIELLQAHGYPFHILCVLTAESMADPDALLDFFLERGLTDIAFNIEEKEGAHKGTSLGGPEGEALYRTFMRRMAERAIRERDRFRFREIESILHLIALPSEQRRVNHLIRPLAIVSVSVDGKMSTYCPELLGMPSPDFADFAFADVHAEGPEAILEHPAFRRLRAEVDAGVAACHARCSHFDVCGGGAPGNKLFENGCFASSETIFCRLTRKVALDAVLEVLEATGFAYSGE